MWGNCCGCLLPVLWVDPRVWREGASVPCACSVFAMVDARVGARGPRSWRNGEVAEGLIPACAQMGFLLKPVPVVPWVDPRVRGDEPDGRPTLYISLG